MVGLPGAGSTLVARAAGHRVTARVVVSRSYWSVPITNAAGAADSEGRPCAAIGTAIAAG